MMILILNKDLKLVLIDSITRETIYPLSIRVIAGNFSIFVNFMAVKFFNLTLIAMVINTAPLMTFLLAMIIFKESVTIAQFISLLAAFTGVMLMLFGGE